MTSIVGTGRGDLIAGSAEADVIKGRAGSDAIDGAAGADTIDGGDGSDRIFGGDGDDVLTGGAGGDLFEAGLGDNVITDFTVGEDMVLLMEGGEGTITGPDLSTSGPGGLQGLQQDGDDVILHFTSGATLRVLNAMASDFDQTALANWVQGTDAAEELLGGWGRDLLTGGAGADTLEGQNGADTLEGGLGDDVYYVDGTGTGDVYDQGPDLVIEGADGGRDHVISRGGYTLGANIENLTLGAFRGGLPEQPQTRSDGRGNDLDNRITGAVNANRIWGEGGKDKLYGDAGSDTLIGGDGRDRLFGGDGADELWGGRGNDILTGGEGADVFRFTLLADGVDNVRDYSAADGDVIDISAIDARPERLGDQAFSFVDAFGGRAGEAVLAYDEAADRTILRLDADGDAAADFILLIEGQVTADDGWAL